MTRKDLLRSLTGIGLTRAQAEDSLGAFFRVILSALRAGGKVSIVGLGSWEWRKRRARWARNPKTGERLPLPPRKVLLFKPSPLFKKKLSLRRLKPR
jgi:nucleoid DNA-binding protein